MADAPAPLDTMGLREFADHMGWKASYITELKGKGHLVMTADKRRIVVADTKRLLADLKDPAKAPVAARHAATRAAGKGQAAPQASAADTAPDSADAAEPEPAPDSPFARRRAEAQAKLAEAQVRRAEREELVELGELLERGPTVAAIGKHLAALCTRLRSLPNTLAPALAAGDEARCRVLLGEEIEQALADVERKLKSIGREG